MGGGVGDELQHVQAGGEADVTRRSMTPARRLRIWNAAGGLCDECGEPVSLADCDIDHRIPLWVSLDDSDSNLRVLHREDCHREKTASDKRVIAKIKRILARTDGTRRPRKAIQSRGFPKGSKPIPSRPFAKKRP